jgi:hypothetical protein
MRRKGPGRPPLPQGERVKDLLKIMFPIRPETRRLLDTLVTVLGSTAYKVIEVALLKFHAGLASGARKRVDAALKGTKLPGARTASIDVAAEHEQTVRAFIDLLDHPKGEVQVALADYMLKTLNARKGQRI